MNKKNRILSTRRTNYGRTLNEYMAMHKLAIYTKCPAKWFFVDVENNNIWTREHETDEWRMASVIQLKEITRAVFKLMKWAKAKEAGGFCIEVNFNKKNKKIKK